MVLRQKRHWKLFKKWWSKIVAKNIGAKLKSKWGENREN
jgi:hypothetical protein